MPKFTLTIECASQEELFNLVVHRLLRGGTAVTSSFDTDLVPEAGARFPDEPPAEEPQELETQALTPETQTPPAPPPPEKRRGRPPKTLKPGEPTLNGNGEKHLPDLDALKNAVVAAVKATKMGGDTKVLDLLPDFKEKTGLQFVMDAKDEHRQALFDLIQKAGLELA